VALFRTKKPAKKSTEIHKIASKKCTNFPEKKNWKNNYYSYMRYSYPPGKQKHYN
jgi:hypothetical protein